MIGADDDDGGDGFHCPHLSASGASFGEKWSSTTTLADDVISWKRLVATAAATAVAAPRRKRSVAACRQRCDLEEGEAAEGATAAAAAVELCSLCLSCL